MLGTWGRGILLACVGRVWHDTSWGSGAAQRGMTRAAGEFGGRRQGRASRTSPPAWDGRLDAPGQRRRHLPSSAWTRRREVKQGKSGGSVGTTDQGKGKGRSVVRPMGTVAYGGKGQGKGKGRGEGRLGQGGRGRSKGGEKLMGTTAYGGKGSKGRAANGDRPVGAASCRRDHHIMASCQNPHLSPAASCRRDHHTMASCQNPHLSPPFGVDGHRFSLPPKAPLHEQPAPTTSCSRLCPTSSAVYATPGAAFAAATAFCRRLQSSLSTCPLKQRASPEVECFDSTIPVPFASAAIGCTPTTGQSRICFRGSSTVRIELDAVCSARQPPKAL